jgi:hypothetical protein
MRSFDVDRGSDEAIVGCAKPLSRFVRPIHMSNDDRQTSAPPLVTVVQAGTATPVAAPDRLSLVATTPPALADPEMLMEALRYLQQHIPGFTHLSVQEKRAHSRAANLDPEFLEHGLHTAVAWHETKGLVGRSGEELRQEQEEIRRWEQTLVELRAFTDGIEASTTMRKHRLGSAILFIYRVLGNRINDPVPGAAYMRPYYENMKRAYLKTQRFRRRTKKEEPAEE